MSSRRMLSANFGTRVSGVCGGRTSPPGARITRERVHTVLTIVRAMTGAHLTNVHLIKFTNNAVFALPASGVVVRIAASATMAERVDKVIRIARWQRRLDTYRDGDQEARWSAYVRAA